MKKKKKQEVRHAAHRVLLSLCSVCACARFGSDILTSAALYSLQSLHTASAERAHSRTIGHVMKYLYCKNDDDECASLVIVDVAVVVVVAVRVYYYKDSNVSLYWFVGMSLVMLPFAVL